MTRYIKENGDLVPLGHGPAGPEGPPGITVVNHGAAADFPRPDTTGVVLWRGSVQPTNWDIDKDLWLEVIL